MSEEKYLDIDNHFQKIDQNPQLIEGLYQSNLVTRKGPNNRSKQFYTDYIAQHLIRRIRKVNLFEEHIEESRRNSYKTDHDGVTENFNDTSLEKIFAKSLWGHKVKNLGRIIDYEIPLSESSKYCENPKSYGDIDLVSINKDNKTAYLIELKLSSRAHETLLKASLEIETYNQLLCENKFQKYLNGKINKHYGNHTLSSVDISSLNIHKAVVFAVDKSSGLPQELREQNKGQYQNLKKLLAELNIGVFVMDYEYPATRMSIA